MRPFTEQIKLIAGGEFAASPVRDECPACYHFSPHVDDPADGYRCKVHGACPAVDMTEEQKARLWEELDVLRQQCMRIQ